MRVIFTCGGTAGHVNPALALAGYMQSRHSDLRVLFVGTPNGMERTLVEKAGYDFQGVEISNFHRSFAPAEVRHNLHTLRTMRTSRAKARAIVRDFCPDLAVGTGGYASYPIIRAASAAGIPTAVHESNIVPGLATRLLEPYARRIMVGFEDCRTHYRHGEKVVVTGTPVRGDFFAFSPAQARQKLGLAEGVPLVVSFWGSLGAAGMNEKMLEMFTKEKAAGYPFYHVHAAGSRSWNDMRTAWQERALTGSDRLDIREYIYDMALYMRAADLVICRAGASTISEITALGVPALIVPSPYVTNNHQEKNARLLERRGGAVVLRESECTGAQLYDTVCMLLGDEARRRKMGEQMASLGVPDATARLYDTVMALVR